MLLDNRTQGKVGDVLSSGIRKDARLSIISSFFSIYGFAAMKRELARIAGLRLLLPLDGASQELPLHVPGLAGTEADRRFRNALNLTANRTRVRPVAGPEGGDQGCHFAGSPESVSRCEPQWRCRGDPRQFDVHVLRPWLRAVGPLRDEHLLHDARRDGQSCWAGLSRSGQTQRRLATSRRPYSTTRRDVRQQVPRTRLLPDALQHLPRVAGRA